jgi:sarcosine oxidase subunit gamma
MENIAHSKSPLSGVCNPGGQVFGAYSSAPGVAFAERRDLMLLSLRGKVQDAAWLERVTGALGCELPKPCRSADSAIAGALGLGPDEWLIVSGSDSAIASTLSARAAYVTDVSHGRACLRLSGARARDLLAKGTSIDLHPRAFQPGHCAATALAKISVVLHQVDASPTYDLYAMRSYTLSLWHWLTEAAAEYGYRIDPPHPGRQQALT